MHVQYEYASFEIRKSQIFILFQLRVYLNLYTVRRFTRSTHETYVHQFHVTPPFICALWIVQESTIQITHILS